jgi:hypothetical protein
MQKRVLHDKKLFNSKYIVIFLIRKILKRARPTRYYKCPLRENLKQENFFTQQNFENLRVALHSFF